MTALNPSQQEFEFPFSAEDFQKLSSLVYSLSGIVLGSHKKNMVYSRLSRRLRALDLRSFAEYCALLQSNDGDQEIGFLLNSITTNLTKFFREDHHFQHLKTVVLAGVEAGAAKSGARRLRIWSAGCSTGEEPYSMAMTVAEALKNLAQWDAKILATDLDTNVLQTAMTGHYSTSALEVIPQPFQSKYLDIDNASEMLTIKPVLKNLITFKQLNLLGNWPMKGPFDVIFCRNVMIYFDSKTKSDLVNRFSALLKPNGFLCVGHSESLLEYQTDLKLVGRTIYQKVKS